MSSHAWLLDKACYGALRGTSRAGGGTSEKACSSVVICRALYSHSQLSFGSFSACPFFLLPLIFFFTSSFCHSHTDKTRSHSCSSSIHIFCPRGQHSVMSVYLKCLPKLFTPLKLVYILTQSSVYWNRICVIDQHK